MNSLFTLQNSSNRIKSILLILIGVQIDKIFRDFFFFFVYIENSSNRMKSILLILILIGIGIHYHQSETCPHPAFTRKHHCQHCQNEEDALEFSSPRRGETGRNSVLAGNVMNFQINDRGHCQNENLGVVYECNLQMGYCRLRGEQCTTYHNTGNGHLYYDSTRCLDNKVWKPSPDITLNLMRNSL